MRPTITGGPETVAAQLQAVCEAGVGIADLIFSADLLPPEVPPESVKLFSKEVIPAFR
ncbi:hypothetical protein [Microbispora siamensis]|uniref:hypothetical protein n=1 Tax=Microbispora siamensis TaxID=564413 RepID=UPI00194DBC4C|nr:hypothetical protein [Microbispora siamensis]